ncbi:hypothetical protein DWV46_03840 [Sellimonas intestinalis]|jgi:hypothetical protein|uniref:Uncharacterized protein n=1 Tax=Sellimonas intestinalis TaxID=1653434 RepID=A0A3E3K389_9FIRM|nr:MAG: hypothetical protein DBY12_03960 [Ruminococcus sp.]RGD37896.1 hypothetical protein DW166_06685 [Sellimonas intestinalis]RGE51217.1 hypothetical protein DW871_06840 [Sellimonas intestinalis]RGE54187.1 hypothetical protein DWW28_05820 [Sellimonas intestinalis]RGE62022.1 hypothetical protein DWV46_03840 [Sellimonas intestinalis]
MSRTGHLSPSFFDRSALFYPNTFARTPRLYTLFFSPFWIVFYQVHGPDALFRLAAFSFPENPDHAGALLFVFYRCSI